MESFPFPFCRPFVSRIPPTPMPTLAMRVGADFDDVWKLFAHYEEDVRSEECVDFRVKAKSTKAALSFFGASLAHLKRKVMQRVGCPVGESIRREEVHLLQQEAYELNQNVGCLIERNAGRKIWKLALGE